MREEERRKGEMSDFEGFAKLKRNSKERRESHVSIHKFTILAFTYNKK